MTSSQAANGDRQAGPTGSWPETFAVFLKLGLTSFGGPIAHLGYFRDELVVRRRWLADAAYADLVALCQFLPGPASSQVGIAIGLTRRRAARRARRLDRLHAALGAGDDPLRLRRRRLRR
jgi:chromate transporter